MHGERARRSGRQPPLLPPPEVALPHVDVPLGGIRRVREVCSNVQDVAWVQRAEVQVTRSRQASSWRGFRRFLVRARRVKTLLMATIPFAVVLVAPSRVRSGTVPTRVAPSSFVLALEPAGEHGGGVRQDLAPQALDLRARAPERGGDTRQGVAGRRAGRRRGGCAPRLARGGPALLRGSRREGHRRDPRLAEACGRGRRGSPMLPRFGKPPESTCSVCYLRASSSTAAGFFHDQNQYGKQSLICALDRGEVFRD